MTGGNMYDWVGYTWNPLAGECPHQCEYCYVKTLRNIYPALREKYAGPIRLDEKALKKKFPDDGIIFVCSMNDLFADSVPEEYIRKILEVARRNRKPEYDRAFLFQTKNPARMMDFVNEFPEGSFFITTIETNKNILKTNAPPPVRRYEAFAEFKKERLKYCKWDIYEITVEPIAIFDVDILATWIKNIKPDYVNIGADSKHHHLPEPSEEDVIALVKAIEEVGAFVHLKANLKRIAPSLFKEVKK